MILRFTLYLFTLATVLLALIIPSGGSEAGRSDQGLSFVSGVVVDERGFPVPYAKVIINANEVTADVSGRFTQMNVSFPYDAVVAERYTSTAVIYRGLSVSDPELVLFGEPDYRNFNSASIRVEFPPLPDTSDAYISFVSREKIFCETKKIASGSDYATISVDFPASLTNIRGDVIMIRKNPSGYEFFRKKSVYLSRGTQNNKTVLPAKPESKAGITSVKVLSSLRNYYQSEISIAFDFTDYSVNSQMTVAEIDGKKQKSIIELPSKLPNSVRLKVNAYADTRSGSKFRTYFYTSPGKELKITDEFLPELIVPSEGYMGANANTEFRYSVGSGAGIYVVEFRSRNPDMKYFVVTNETSARLPILARQELTNFGSVTFSWRVRKYLTYFSVDEFIRPNIFKNEIGYKGVLFSNGRNFRTGYF